MLVKELSTEVLRNDTQRGNTAANNGKIADVFYTSSENQEVS